MWLYQSRVEHHLQLADWLWLPVSPPHVVEQVIVAVLCCMFQAHWTRCIYMTFQVTTQKQTASVKSLEHGDRPKCSMQQFLAMHEHALEALIYF